MRQAQTETRLFNKLKKVSAAFASTGLFWMLPLQHAHAQDSAANFPNKTITIVVPFSAGGTTDILARLVSLHLSKKFGHSVVVENKAGAGGNIGTSAVARAPADGYTLVMGTIGTHTINPSLYKNMPYDAIKDFAPITRVAMVPNLLVANKDAPFNNVPELIAYAKANPGKLSFGSSGNGTTLHLSGELFKLKTGINMTHIPYKGSSPAVADLISGQINMIFDNMPSAYPQVKNGRLKAIGVTSAKRDPLLPDTPAVQETVPGFEVMSWFGLWAPAATPIPILNKLNKEIVEIINKPDVQETIRSQGAMPMPETSKEFAAFINEETKKWADVVKEAKVTIN